MRVGRVASVRCDTPVTVYPVRTFVCRTVSGTVPGAHENKDAAFMLGGGRSGMVSPLFLSDRIRRRGGAVRAAAAPVEARRAALCSSR
eukprot:3192236-Pleurochrysis_carterae.AAC.2